MELNITKITFLLDYMEYDEEHEMVRIPSELLIDDETLFVSLCYSGIREKFEINGLYNLSIKERENLIKQILSTEEYAKNQLIIEKFIEKNSRPSLESSLEIIKCYSDVVGNPVIDIMIGGEIGSVYFKRNREGTMEPYSTSFESSHIGFTKQVFNIAKEKAKLFLLMNE